MKAILVIEMPENCDICDLSNTVHGYHENCLNHEFFETDIDFYVRPSWCPLKPPPNKLIHENEWYEDDKMSGYINGWNACLTEILGEK